jgi:hypothetical protein
MPQLEELSVGCTSLDGEPWQHSSAPSCHDSMACCWGAALQGHPHLHSLQLEVRELESRPRTQHSTDAAGAGWQQQQCQVRCIQLLQLSSCPALASVELWVQGAEADTLLQGLAGCRGLQQLVLRSMAAPPSSKRLGSGAAQGSAATGSGLQMLAQGPCSQSLQILQIHSSMGHGAWGFRLADLLPLLAAEGSCRALQVLQVPLVLEAPGSSGSSSNSSLLGQPAQHNPLAAAVMQQLRGLGLQVQNAGPFDTVCRVVDVLVGGQVRLACTLVSSPS